MNIDFFYIASYLYIICFLLQNNPTSPVEEGQLVSKEKLLLAKQVKKGKCGDSLYAKNLTSFSEPQRTSKTGVLPAGNVTHKRTVWADGC